MAPPVESLYDIAFCICLVSDVFRTIISSAYLCQSCEILENSILNAFLVCFAQEMCKHVTEIVRCNWSAMFFGWRRLCHYCQPHFLSEFLLQDFWLCLGYYRGDLYLSVCLSVSVVCAQRIVNLSSWSSSFHHQHLDSTYVRLAVLCWLTALCWQQKHSFKTQFHDSRMLMTPSASTSVT